ncbi:MAG: hypothetical protein LBU24_05830 [Methanocalculaceae archaeon]|nr:hypothetical protein [Methanocalculaceae archaeon]
MDTQKARDYLIKTVKLDFPPMSERYIAPIFSKEECKPETEQVTAHEFFESEGIANASASMPEVANPMDPETVRECPKALRTLYDSHVLTWGTILQVSAAIARKTRYLTLFRIDFLSETQM